MKLSEKIELLRGLEGSLRGLRRPLSKSEVARLIEEELGETISQAYLSQLESGKREHMTAKTRELLARFFKVHPGFLVDDPEDYRMELSTTPLLEGRLDGWLEAAAQDMERDDEEMAQALRDLAASPVTRQVMLLLSRLSRQPDLLSALGSPVGLDIELSLDEDSHESAERPKKKSGKTKGRSREK